MTTLHPSLICVKVNKNAYLVDAAVVVLDDDLAVVRPTVGYACFDFFNARVDYAKVERVAVKSSLMNRNQEMFICPLMQTVTNHIIQNNS